MDQQVQNRRKRFMQTYVEDASIETTCLSLKIHSTHPPNP